MNTKKIYFYSTPAHYEDQIELDRVPMLKIGDTLREDAEYRINEQDTTSNPQKLVCKGIFETTFSDKEFHLYLLGKGYTKSRSEREWFRITVEDATYELEQYKGVKSVSKVAETRKLYKHQEEFLTKILSGWEQWKEFLLFAKCRAGKSTMVLSAIVKSGVKVTLGVSRYKSPEQSWLGDSKLKNFENLVFININEKGYKEKIGKYIATDKQIFLWGCIQSRKLMNLPCNVDLIVYDEAHQGYDSKQWNELRDFHDCKVLYVTGTAYKLLFDFDENSRYCYSYYEEQLDAKNGITQGRIIPKLNLFVAKYESKEYQKIFGDDPAAMKNIFNTLPNGDFVNPSLPQEFVSMYFSIQRELSTQDRIFKNTTHIYATLPSVAACHSFAKFLNGTRFTPLVVTGETKEDAVTINAHIDANPTGTVILTRSANVLGVTVPKIDTVINLTEGKSLEFYIQFAFRGGSGERNWNLFDFCPERAIQSMSSTFDQACDANPVLAEYEFSDFVDIFSWSNGFKKLGVDQVNEILSSNVENTIDMMGSFVDRMNKKILSSIECNTNLKSLGKSFGRDPYSVNSNDTNGKSNKNYIEDTKENGKIKDKVDNTTELQVREYGKRIPLAVFHCIRKNVQTTNVINFLDTSYYINNTNDVDQVFKIYFKKTSGRERERFQRYLSKITSNIKSSINKDECLTLDKLSHSGQYHKPLPLDFIDYLFSS